jgi:hypothetical protein
MLPVTRNIILNLLKERGPMTVPEIAAALKFTVTRVHGSVYEARVKYGSDIFCVHGYRLKVGSNGREAKIYAPGPGEDAPRPNFNTVEHRRLIDRRYREKSRSEYTL